MLIAKFIQLCLLLLAMNSFDVKKWHFHFLCYHVLFSNFQSCNKVCHYFVMFSSGTFSKLPQISTGLWKMWTRKHTQRYGKSLFCHHECLALFKKYVQGSCAPWKSLKVLENCSGYWKVLELQCLLISLRRTAKEKEQTQSTFGIKFSWCGRTKKRQTQGSFLALNIVLEKCEMCPWKFLNFLFKNGYEPCM